MLAMYTGQYHAENDCPTMKNRGLGPLGPSILDPICEHFSESHKLKLFGVRKQFRAERFVTVLIITRSINAMEWVVET